MANTMFPLGREGFLAGEIDWNTADIKVALVRGYTYDATDKFVSDLAGTGGTVHATSAALASKTVTQGVADAADITFTAVTATSAAPCALVVYQSSLVTGVGGDVATSAQRLIAIFDTGTNLPVTPNGGDISIAWDAGANRIFTL